MPIPAFSVEGPFLHVTIRGERGNCTHLTMNRYMTNCLLSFYNSTELVHTGNLINTNNV